MCLQGSIIVTDQEDNSQGQSGNLKLEEKDLGSKQNVDVFTMCYMSMSKASKPDDIDE